MATPLPIIDPAELDPPCRFRGQVLFGRKGQNVHHCPHAPERACVTGEAQRGATACRTCTTRVKPRAARQPEVFPRKRVALELPAGDRQPVRTVWDCPHRSAEPHAEVPCTGCGRTGQLEPVFRCSLYACDCTIRRHARGPQEERICQSCPGLPEASA